MIKQYVMCDTCGTMQPNNETDWTFPPEDGWIRIHGNIMVGVGEGMYLLNNADFCSHKCMLETMAVMKEKRLQK